MWTTAEIHAACLDSLVAHAQALEAEQAVRGLDALSELQLHPILAAGLAEELGLHVLREVPYPAAHVVREGKRPKRSERERCDLVLLPAGATKLRDAVEDAKRIDAAAGTLFGASEVSAVDQSREPLPEDAFWLEIKSVGQHVIVDGAARPSRAYASELRQALRTDLAKLAGAEQIRTGGLLLVLFADSERTASHDWDVAMEGVAGTPSLAWARTGCAPINERIGNHVCFVGLAPIDKG